MYHNGFMLYQYWVICPALEINLATRQRLLLFQFCMILYMDAFTLEITKRAGNPEDKRTLYGVGYKERGKLTFPHIWKPHCAKMQGVT